MGRKLSLLCPCLPQKQRDNLSSRSLYLDDSSGQEDYSDDDEYMRVGTEHPHQGSRARLQSFLARPSAPYSKTTPPLANAWPSTLSNGRFSRHSGRNKIQRKPNPFQAPYRDDDSDNNDTADGNEEGYPNDHTAASESPNRGRGRRTSFEPYRDDDSDDELSPSRASGDAGSTHAKSAPSPYRVEVAPVPQRMRVPRNTQGKMIWGDEEDEEDEEDDDAEEVIDVDALLAEQERITKDLAAQEEALREKEETAVVAKRRAAIQAAERRGLLRLDNDDQGLLRKSQKPEEESSVTQDGDAWSQSTPLREPQAVPKVSPTSTPSRASSYVGGADEFDQELKMMTFDIKNKGAPTTSKSLACADSQEILGVVSSSKKIDGTTTEDTSDDTPSKHEKSTSNDRSTIPGHYSTATASPSANGQDMLAIHTETDDIYPVDPFNPSSPPTTHEIHDQQYPADKLLPPTQKNKDQEEEPAHGDKETPSRPEQANPEQQQTTPAGAGASERIMGTFTSIFNTGSSLMGYFGSGHQEAAPVLDQKEDSDDHRLSEVKTGNPPPAPPPPPRRHFFDYSAAAVSVASAAVAAVVGQSTAKKPPADDEDNSSIDDYDF